MQALPQEIASTFFVRDQGGVMIRRSATLVHSDLYARIVIDYYLYWMLMNHLSNGEPTHEHTE